MEFEIKGKRITKVEKDFLFELGFKWCSRCRKAIEFDNFSLNSKMIDGYNAICKECSKNKRQDNLEYYKQRDANRYKNKREELVHKAAVYRESHQKEIKELREKYYSQNKEIILDRNKKYRRDNISKIKELQKEYHSKNKEIRNFNSREYGKKNRERLTEYCRNRYNNNDEYRLRKICREMVRRMFDSIHSDKILKTNEVLGYSALELKEHIERQFKEGMTWDNYGEWHIDHIVPISSAKNLEEGIELSKLENLQPLWAVDNLSKGDRMIFKGEE
jgi:hypothetical protein